MRLREIFVTTLVPIEESTGDAKPKVCRARAKLMTVDVVNENRRLYPAAHVDRAITKLTEKINARRTLMGDGHPPVINGVAADDRPSESAAILTAVRREGADVIGEIELLNTSRGRDIRAIVEQGVPLPVSLRGSGTQKREQLDGASVDVIQEDLEFETWDFVTGPGFADAGITHHMEESAMKNLAEAKEKHPELVAELLKEAAAAVADKVKAEVAEAHKAEIASLTAKLKEGEEQLGKVGVEHEQALQAIAAILAKLGWKVDFSCCAGNLPADGATGPVVPSAPGTDAAAQAVKMDAMIKAQNALLVEVASLKEKLASAEVTKHIDDKLAGMEPVVREAIRARLVGAKTVAEVDVVLSETKAIVEAVGKSYGKGRTFAAEPTGLTRQQASDLELLGINS